MIIKGTGLKKNISFLECQPAYVVCCKNSCVISCLLNRMLKELSEIIYISVKKKSISHGRPVDFASRIPYTSNIVLAIYKKPNMGEIGSIICLIFNIRDLEAPEEKYIAQLVLYFHNKSTPFLMIFCKCVSNTGTTHPSNLPTPIKILNLLKQN